jgi:hypothetical protein
VFAHGRQDVPGRVGSRRERRGMCVCNDKWGSLQRGGAEDEQGIEGGVD